MVRKGSWVQIPVVAPFYNTKIMLKRLFRPNPKPADLESRKSEARTRISASVLGASALTISAFVEYQTETYTAANDMSRISVLLGAAAVSVPVMAELLERYRGNGGGWGNDGEGSFDPDPKPAFGKEFDNTADWDGEYYKLLDSERAIV